jgi:hypothetical protein
MADIHRAPKIVFSRSSEPRLRESLDGMFAGLPFKVPNGVRIQLSSALFAMQRSALLVGIEADLKLFSGREILYVKLSPAKEGELQGVLGDTEELGRFDPGAGPARKRTHSDAYAYYCEKILSPARGVDHFLSRNPKVGSLLDRSTSNFTGNVRECLSRLRADKYVLERVFLDGGAITSLSGITHTGSDSHNGGKQVLFLDLGYKNQKGKSDEKRIVYKPSDVEIDYLIAGSNTPVLRQVLEEKHSDAGFPLQHESLFELLDRTISGQSTAASPNARRAAQPTSKVCANNWPFPCTRSCPAIREAGCLRERKTSFPSRLPTGTSSSWSTNPACPSG